MAKTVRTVKHFGREHNKKLIKKADNQNKENF